MKIRLIVPNQYTDGFHHCKGSPVDDYGREIAEIAGGFTATQATGGWVDGSNLLVVEPVTVFDCHIGEFDESWHTKRDRFRTLARKIAHELRQECVYLEIDGEVEFVKP